MKRSTRELLEEIIQQASPISLEEINQVEKSLGFDFPDDLKEALVLINSGEGAVGQNGYLVMFPVDRLSEVNNDYSLLMKQIPEYFLFAKDAAETGYAFNKEKQTYHAFGLMSDFRYDMIDLYGNNFDEFIETLDHEYE